MVNVDCPQLPDRTVHVWNTGFSDFSSHHDSLMSLLCREEIDRAARYRIDRDRGRYVIARGLLRSLLSGYLDQSPAALQFSYNTQGKPGLCCRALEFNVSHSGNQVCFAFSRNHAVGVDVERLDPDKDLERLAEQCFSPGELEQFAAVPEERRTEAFYTCWARKEAFIKALGSGLSYPLERFSVSLNPGQKSWSLAVDDNAEDPGKWTLVSVHTGPGYSGALAARGRELDVRRFRAEARDSTIVPCPIVT